MAWVTYAPKLDWKECCFTIITDLSEENALYLDLDNILCFSVEITEAALFGGSYNIEINAPDIPECAFGTYETMEQAVADEKSFLKAVSEKQPHFRFSCKNQRR